MAILDSFKLDGKVAIITGAALVWAKGLALGMPRGRARRS